ncbi:MAG: RHS repeat-associated core domain-containing protein, partial [Myxococcota bacterium]
PSSGTDPLGNTATVAYDALDRVASVTNAAGETMAFTRDAMGRVTAVTDPGGQAWAQSYDAEGLLATLTDPLGATTSLSRDALGRVTSVTSPLGFETSMAYDSMGRATGRTDALGRTTTRSYDTNGRIASVSLPGGIATSAYTRNALGRITQLTDPGGNAWAKAFDNQGRGTSSTDPLGRETSLAYDARSRVSSITFPGGFGSVASNYDANGNLAQALYSDTTNLAFGYDALDRLTSADGVTRSFDAAGRITEGNGLTFTHDAAGRLLTVTYAPGKTVSYAYDARGTLSNVTDWTGSAVTLAYDAAARLASLSRDNGVNTTWSYDTDSRVTNIAHGVLAGVALAYDATGQLTSATRSGPQSAAAPGASTTTQGFDAASQLAGASHDALGRQTQDGGRSYAWDLASRLTSITQGGATTGFEYDGLGRRTARNEGGETRSFVWNDALGLPSVAVEREGGADLRYYVHTPGGALLYSVEAADDSRRFYHFDETGNTVLLTDDAGTVVASYAYGPYGEVVAATPAVDNPYTWQGQLGVAQEGDGGLYYARARYYDSARARFLSTDPIESPGPRGHNPYQYAYANPFRFGDPTGLLPEARPTPEQSGPTIKKGSLSLRAMSEWLDYQFGSFLGLVRLPGISMKELKGTHLDPRFLPWAPGTTGGGVMGQSYKIFRKEDIKDGQLVGSAGSGPCITVALDSPDGRVSIAHFQADCCIADTLDSFAPFLEGTKAYVAGGNTTESSQHQMLLLSEWLEKHPDIEVFCIERTGIFLDNKGQVLTVPPDDWIETIESLVEFSERSSDLIE